MRFAVLLLAGALAAGGASPARAAVNCGDQPKDMPVSLDDSLKVDLNAKAKLLTRVLGGAEIGATVQNSRKELYERHGDVDKHQLDIYWSWISCQNIMGSGMTAEQKQAQLQSFYAALRTPAPASAQDMPLGSRIATGALGLQFRQSGQPVPIQSGPDRVAVVSLRRAPFEILLPGRIWASSSDDFPALQVAVSDDPALLTMARGQHAPEQRLFQPGTGMADDPNGSAELVATRDLSGGHVPHNYILGPRFTVQDGSRRGVFVSAVQMQGDGPNLLASARSLYAVFRLQSEPGGMEPQAIDPIDLDLVRLDLRD